MSRAAGLEKMLPLLPPELVDLEVPGCGIQSIPETWLHHKTLSWIQLNANNITNMPADLTGLASLKDLFLENNYITNLPALRLPKAPVETIRLFGNPLHKVDPGNQDLVNRHVIEYDGNNPAPLEPPGK
jgi:Leucine-rich repeat (LRR) protein